jgi:formate dehydrogenase iron-sulfur subunit
MVEADSMLLSNRAPYPTGRLADGRPRAILFDATVCIGCRHCVQACKDWNDHPRTSLYAISASNWITMEAPVLEGRSRLWGRNSCMHCDFPMCAAVCPVEAITKYAEGPVVIDEEACIGCDYCIHACPWGVIAKNEKTRKASKCTMCHTRIEANEAPFCVEACPVGALAFEPAEEISAKATLRAGEIGGYLYGEKEAGGTRLLYMLKDSFAAYGLRSIGSGKYPKHKIPAAVMIRDLFTLRLGIAAKARALYFAILHPRRLVYRYWPWRRTAS